VTGKDHRIVIKCRRETKDLWDRLAKLTGYERNREALLLLLIKNYLRSQRLGGESL